MTDLPPHDHCRYCGCAVPFEQAYCSMECYNKDHERMRRERRNNLVVTALTAAGVVAILVLGYVF